jgi:uncharacterized lipoprotein YehR (DUF1307 family)
MISMKKLFAILLALVMVFALVACGGDQPAGESGTPTPSQSSQPSGQPGAEPSQSAGQPSGEPSAPAAADAFVFLTGNGTAISVNQDMAEILVTDGDFQSYFEAESCAFNGLDKTYTYAGFIISTRPEEGKDLVNSILLTDDSVTTPEGIYIGSAKSAVVAAYGQGDEVGLSLSYVKGDCTLNFIFDGDTVLSIEYLPVVE